MTNEELASLLTKLEEQVKLHHELFSHILDEAPPSFTDELMTRVNALERAWFGEGGNEGPPYTKQIPGVDYDPDDQSDDRNIRF